MLFRAQVVSGWLLLGVVMTLLFGLGYGMYDPDLLPKQALILGGGIATIFVVMSICENYYEDPEVRRHLAKIEFELWRKEDERLAPAMREIGLAVNILNGPKHPDWVLGGVKRLVEEHTEISAQLETPEVIAEIGARSIRCDELGGQVAALEKSLQLLEPRLEAKKAELSEAEAGLKPKRQEASRLGNEIFEARKQSRSLQTEIAEALASLTGIRAEALKTEAAVRAANEAWEIIEPRRIALEARMAELNRETPEAEARLAELRETAERLGKEIATQSEIKYALEGEVAGLRETQHGLLTASIALESQVSAAENKLAKLTSQLDSDSGGYGQLLASIAEARDELADLRQQRALLIPEVNADKDERRSVRRILNAELGRLEDVQSELETGRASLRELLNEIDQTGLELRQAREELEKLQARKSGLDYASVKGKIREIPSKACPNCNRLQARIAELQQSGSNRSA